MNIRLRLLVVAITAVVTVVAMVAYMQAVQSRFEAGRDAVLMGFDDELIDVFVATRDIPVGDRLSHENTRVEPWPPVLLPRGAMVASETVDGVVASNLIIAGEVVSALRTGDSASSFSVPNGLTAVTVPSEDVRAVGGAVRAGTRVDVYSARGGSATLLARSIDVLATSATDRGTSPGTSPFSGGSGGIDWVTLAIAPDAAEQIIAAADSGSLYLALPTAR